MKNDDSRREFCRRVVSGFFLSVLIFLSVLYYFHIKLPTYIIILVLALLFVVIVVRNIRKFF